MCVWVCVWESVCERASECVWERVRQSTVVRVCRCVYMCVCVCVCKSERLEASHELIPQVRCWRVCVRVWGRVCVWESGYGVATISRLLKMIGLFCRIWSLLWALLQKQKRPLILRSLLIVSTPYVRVRGCMCVSEGLCVCVCVCVCERERVCVEVPGGDS